MKKMELWAQGPVTGSGEGRGLKICYLCPDLGIQVFGEKGASAHLRSLASAFDELGHDVTVLSPGASGAPRAWAGIMPIEIPMIGKALGPSVSRRLGRALGHLWENVAVESALVRFIREDRPDLVYERYSPFSVAGGIVARELGIPHVLEVNSPLSWEGKTFRKQALSDVSDALEREAFENTSLVVCVSQELADILIQSGVDGGKVVVVPNGVDVDFFSPEGPSWSKPEDSFVVGFVGGLKPWHGIAELLEAFRSLVDDPRFHLLVVGDGPEAHAVDAFAQENPGRVTRPGAVSHVHVPYYLRAMDVAVAPYPALERFYYSPLKVLEYMASGVPILASSIGQIPTLLRHGQSALLVPPGEVRSLAESVRLLAEDEGLGRALAASALAEAQAKHRWTSRAVTILEYAGITPTDRGTPPPPPLVDLARKVDRESWWT